MALHSLEAVSIHYYIFNKLNTSSQTVEMEMWRWAQAESLAVSDGISCELPFPPSTHQPVAPSPPLKRVGDTGTVKETQTQMWPMWHSCSSNMHKLQ